MTKTDPLLFVPGDGAAEYWTDERCYITELCNTELLPDASLAIARVEADVTTQLHALRKVTETYIVIEGSGLLEVDGSTMQIGPGDQVVIPAGSSQRIAAADTGIRFYCLCTPRFTPDAYENLEA